MEIDRIELKRQAREAIKLPSPRFWLVTLVYLLATTGVALAVDFIPVPGAEFGFTSLFLTILVTLYTTVVHFGFQLWCLWTHRRLDPGMGSLMQGFSVSGRVILMELNIFIRILGWSVVLGLTASVPLFILISLASSAPILLIPITILWAIFILVTSTYIQLGYSMAPFFLADYPDDGANAAVRRSLDMTRGWKWEMFKLELSFWGWDILNLVLSCLVLAPFLVQPLMSYASLGAASLDVILQTVQQIIYEPLPYILSTLAAVPLSLWLEPYRNVTRAGFYAARLQAQQESAPLL